MSYKIILVHVDDSRHLDQRVEVAAKIAKLHHAHLVGVALTGLPVLFYDPVAFNPVDPYVAQLLEIPRQRAAAALAKFAALATRLGVDSIESRLEENEDAEGITLQARYCDLVVLGQRDPQETMTYSSPDFAETVTLKCGAPVLMVPYANAVTGIGDKALLAWNASKEAKLALHFAIPALQRASRVDVAVFDPDTLPSDYRAVPDKDIVEYLGRHAISAKVTRQVTAGDIDVGNGLLSLATDLASDLLVMGCYGHTRFREVLLGGVTRVVLKSMTLPVLMAH